AGGGGAGAVDGAAAGGDHQDHVGYAGVEPLGQRLVGLGRFRGRVLEAAGGQVLGDTAAQRTGDEDEEQGGHDHGPRAAGGEAGEAGEHGEFPSGVNHVTLSSLSDSLRPPDVQMSSVTARPARRPHRAERFCPRLDPWVNLPGGCEAATHPGACAPERIRTVASHGIHIAVHQWGAPAAPPLALAHGGFDFARTFDVFAPLLAAGGWRVVSWDQRGHGDSEHAPLYSWDADARDALAVLDSTTSEPVPFVGHSKGG